MLWRPPRGRPNNAPPGFIHPCQPKVATRPPAGPGWVHELKQDGYRLQIHIRASRVRLFTMNGHDWTERYPLIVRDGARLNRDAILDAEVVCADSNGKPDFDLLHSRCNDDVAVACAFDLLMLEGEDLRRYPFALRKAMLRKLLKAERVGLQYVDHIEGNGDKMFEAVCKLGLEGIVSKKLDAPYRSGPSKTWIKAKNPKAPAATRATDGSF